MRVIALRKMKIKNTTNTACALLLVIMAMLLAGCGGEQAADTPDVNASTENLAGHVTIDGNTLYLDEARVIIYDLLYPDHSFSRHAGENIVVVARGDTEKLNELGSEVNGDWLQIWPSGFSVEPLGMEPVSFELTNDTVFTFEDSGFLFLDDSYMNRTYHTSIADEFLMHRGDSNTILFVQAQNGRVISVVEEFLFTQ